jgi:hypothetical protein
LEKQFICDEILEEQLKGSGQALLDIVNNDPPTPLPQKKVL